MPPASSFSAETVYPVRSSEELPWLQRELRALAARAGFRRREQWAIATAATEAVTNMLKYAGGGVLTVRARAAWPWLELEAADHGPGITDLAHALEDGVSEGARPEEVPDLRRRRGLGLGLGAIRRLMDEVEIRAAADGGTILLARKTR
jgi:serine/threonine-protein kinase RsbT